MKNKLGVIFLFTLILSSVLVFALENSSIGDISLNKEGIKQDLATTSQEVKTSFKEQLADQREIPDSISFLPKLFFGIEDKISISEFIIYSTLFILILLLVNSIISFFPFAEKSYTWIISGIIMLLAGYSGGIEKGAIIWMNLLSSISLFEKMGSWTISILLVILVISTILLSKLQKTIKETSKITQASYEGMKAGTGIAISKIRSKYF